MDFLSLLWNEVIFNPMLNGVVWLYAILGRNFGVTIIVFTIIIRILTLPLTLRQIRSTAKMSQLQPRMQAIQQRYAKDRARISQETMRLYKEAGVSPLGCLGPMVIQFPIWIGLYMAIVQVLPTSPEALASLSTHLYAWLPVVHEVVPLNPRFLWMDLTVPGGYLMAALVGASMWVMQKMSTPLSADPRQQSTNQMMLWIMPFMFGFFTLTLPSGLPLYWFVSNVIGVVIQGSVTGWSGILSWKGIIPWKTQKPAPAAVAVEVDAAQGDAKSIQSKETVSDGPSGDERQDRRGSNRARPKGARRRARGSRHRGS